MFFQVPPILKIFAKYFIEYDSDMNKFILLLKQFKHLFKLFI